MLTWWLNGLSPDDDKWIEGKDKIMSIKKDYDDWVTSLETNPTQ